jgi:hypothetical protein
MTNNLFTDTHFKMCASFDVALCCGCDHGPTPCACQHHTIATRLVLLQLTASPGWRVSSEIWPASSSSSVEHQQAWLGVVQQGVGETLEAIAR